MLDSGASRETTETAAADSTPVTSLSPTNLSHSEAVRMLGHSLLDLIFEDGGFEEMIDGAGLGLLAKAARPIVQKRAVASIARITDDQAKWLVDRIHKLSADFEDATGEDSPYHYAEV